MNARILINRLIQPLGYTLQRFKTSKNPFLHQRSILKSLDVKTIFDVGAHTGQSVRKYREYFPEAHIHSFEPFGPSFEKLCAACQKDPLVTTINKGVSDHIGSANYHVNAFSQTNSLLASSPNVGKYMDAALMDTIETQDIDVTTIDGYMSECGLESIEILKLDIQGAELQALRGAESHLVDGRIALIYSEVEFVDYYEQQPLFFDLHTHLSSRGYVLCGLFDQGYSPLGQLSVGDAVWVHTAQLSA